MELWRWDEKISSCWKLRCLKESLSGEQDVICVLEREPRLGRRRREDFDENSYGKYGALQESARFSSVAVVPTRFVSRSLLMPQLLTLLNDHNSNGSRDELLLA